MGDPHTDFRWTWHLWAPGDPGDGDRPTFLPRMLWFGADLSSFTWADDRATAAVDKVSGWRQVGWVQAFSPSHPFSSVQQKHVESLQTATQRNKKLFVKEAGNLALVQVKVKVAQSRPTLCNPMDYTVNGILPARILEWIAFPFSRGSSQHRDGTQVSCIAGRFFPSWATREAQEYWSRQPSLLQGIFLTQESNWGLLHCRQMLYQPSYEGRPPEQSSHAKHSGDMKFTSLSSSRDYNSPW